MQTKILLVAVIFFCVDIAAQSSVNSHPPSVDELTIKKQLVVDDVENQLKDVQFAGVRVYVRYKLAAWLWQKGEDKTGSAEQIAVKALEELEKKKAEIPSPYYDKLRSDIFSLLELHAKDAVKRLREKFAVGSDDDLESARALMEGSNGEKLVAEKIKRFLAKERHLNPTLISLVRELEIRRSSELPGVLSAIVGYAEARTIELSSSSLIFLLPTFRSTALAPDLKLRFMKIVVYECGKHLQSGGTQELESAFNLLREVMNEISDLSPKLFSEASVQYAVFQSRLSHKLRNEKERNERIENSADKLAALISEAEKATDEADRYQLYVTAAQLALRNDKLAFAVELAQKSLEGENKVIAKDFRELWHDQFLAEVTESALKKGSVEIAHLSTKRIIDSAAKSEVLRKTAIHFDVEQKFILAKEALDEGIKLTDKLENGGPKVFTMIRLLSTAQRIDSSYLPELLVKTAKAIDTLPSPDVADKPESDAYKVHVTSAMVVNWNLYPTITALVRVNRGAAVDLASRINRREIKVVANLAVLMDSATSPLNVTSTLK